MQIAILGAGGVGGYYAGVLARAGQDVAVLARGEHLAAIQSDGLEIHEPDAEPWRVSVSAYESAVDMPDADVAFVAVKSYSLDAIAAAAVDLAGRGAVVVPLLNGVDIVDRLADAGVPRASLLAGLTYVSAAKTGPGVIELRSDFRRVTVGEPDGGMSERAEHVAAAFAGTPVDARATANIQVELWRKFVFIAAISAACGLARTAIGPVRDATRGRLLLERAVREVVAVARARGVALPDGEAQEVIQRLDNLAPGLSPSFLLDVQAGGPAELDILSGAVSRLGAEAGVETPVHDTATAALSAALG
ncbi:MAG TPA: 2-dehydropantoate 2-reductase [Longimicrobiales bacterium]|nr:2-dehydropantoate 2-reductase [Longimicrobiales bacterium]